MDFEIVAQALRDFCVSGFHHPPHLQGPNFVYCETKSGIVITVSWDGQVFGVDMQHNEVRALFGSADGVCCGATILAAHNKLLREIHEVTHKLRQACNV